MSKCTYPIPSNQQNFETSIIISYLRLWCKIKSQSVQEQYSERSYYEQKEKCRATLEETSKEKEDKTPMTLPATKTVRNNWNLANHMDYIAS